MSYPAHYCEYERAKLAEAKLWCADAHKKLGAAMRLGWFYMKPEGRVLLEDILDELHSMGSHDDNVGPQWCDDAHEALHEARTAGMIQHKTSAEDALLDDLGWGLMMLGDLVNAIAMGFPPPALMAPGGLHLVKG